MDIKELSEMLLPIQREFAKHRDEAGELSERNITNSDFDMYWYFSGKKDAYQESIKLIAHLIYNKLNE